MTISGNFTLSGFDFAWTGPVSAGSSNRTITVNNTTTVSGAFSATGTLIISGTGSLVLANNSAPSGSFSVNSNLTFGVRTGTGILARTITGMTINSGGNTILTDPADHANRTVLTTSSLTISGSTNAWTGLLNLNGNDMIVKNSSSTAANTSLATITNQIKAGEDIASGINWSGTTGITSTTAIDQTNHYYALGVIRNADLSGNQVYGTTTTFGAFDGQNPDANAILVKFTYYGDADLNGKVDAADYSHIDAGANSGGTLTGWAWGDFNYDGVINATDYTLIDNVGNASGLSILALMRMPHWKIPGYAALYLPIYESHFGRLSPTEEQAALTAGTPLPGATMQSETAALPEPTSAGMLASIGLLLLRRRRDIH